MSNSFNKLERRQVVFVPIEGLKMSVSSLEIGTVTFYPRSNGCEFDQALEDVLKQYNLKASDLTTNFIKIACYAKVEAFGDTEFVRDEAVKRTKEAIHILNLYGGSSTYQTKSKSIGFSQLIVNRNLTDDKHQNSDVGFLESYPPQIRFEIDLKNVNTWAHMDLETMNNCFHRKKDAEIEERIQRATNWYGKAVDTDSPEEKFVNLAIALESLLIGDEGKGLNKTTGSINQKIGERVAFLLGTDFNNRIEKEKEAKYLYDIRSDIVHSGKSVNKQDLIKMDELVKQAVLFFLRHKFTKWEEFREWIAHQRYDDMKSSNTNTT